MIKCSKEYVKNIEPFFVGEDDIPLQAFLEGRLGNAYVDSEEHPTAAMVVVKDFVYFGGDANSPCAEELVRGFADIKQGTMRLIPPTAAWSTIIGKIYPQAIHGVRFAFRKDTKFDTEKLESFAVPPEGFTLRAITAVDYPQLISEKWSRDFVSFCSDGEEFEREGVGILICNESGEVVAGASSFLRCSTGIEIQIETREDYRRRGLATVCSAKLMLVCIERNLFPNWDAANDTSARIAKKLGYEPKGEYEVYKVL